MSEMTPSATPPSAPARATPPLTAPAAPPLAAPKRDVPRDPAPSRLAYRVQRVWLTPLYRALIRVGIPSFSVVLGVAVFLGDQDRLDAIRNQIVEIRRSIEERPEFMVSMMELVGASRSVGDDIREIVPVDFPVSSFDLDLDAMRAAIEGLDAVREADVLVRSGGVLEVRVSERVPAAVWYTRDGIEALDATGHRVKPIEPGDGVPGLYRIAGAGADKAVPEALALFAVAAALGDRVHGLLRVGERRWDVLLRDGKVIQLPEQMPDRVLERVIALHEARDLLDRDIARVDMRLTNRPTLRLKDGAMAELRHIQAIEMGTGQ